MGRGKRGWRVGFWNMAGLRNKDADFWEKLKEWEVMVLMETWVKKKGWERVKGSLPKGYIWGVQWAERECKKGRARDGMLMGIKGELVEKGKGIQVGGRGVIVGNVRSGEQR